MIKLSFAQLAQILELASAPKDDVCKGISTDARTLEPGNLFVAIKGERFDGHDFLEDAKKAGAVAAIVSQAVETDLPCFRVPNTVEALGKITAFWRNQFKAPVVAVTGSNGKTTVKNMIAAILRQACKDPAHCLVSNGNLNNHIGMPLSLLRLSSEHEYAVLEMGMNHFGEISYLSEIAKPNVAVITNAYLAHLEGVCDLNGVAQAKGEIFQGLSETGTAVLNADDNYFDYWNALLDTQEVISFGMEHEADVFAADCQLLSQESLFSLVTADNTLEIVLPVPGRHNVMNALAATAACLALDIDLFIIKKGLESFSSFKSRLVVNEVESLGWVLDDTYNANPASTRAAIDVLKTYHEPTLIILGDMKELGEDCKRLHQQVGEYAKQVGIDYLLSVGECAEDVAKGFGENALFFADKPALFAYLNEFLPSKKPLAILVKGSRSMQMEEVVDFLMD